MRLYSYSLDQALPKRKRVVVDKFGADAEWVPFVANLPHSALSSDDRRAVMRLSVGAPPRYLETAECSRVASCRQSTQPSEVVGSCGETVLQKIPVDKK